MRKRFNDQPQSTLPDTIDLNKRIIILMNYRPVDFTHSDTFIDAGTNIPEKAREIVSRIPLEALDEMNCNFADPKIDGETKEEIEFGGKQFAEHLGHIASLTIDIPEAALEAESRKEIYLKELEGHKKELERLLALQDAYLKGEN